MGRGGLMEMMNHRHRNWVYCFDLGGCGVLRESKVEERIGMKLKLAF